MRVLLLAPAVLCLSAAPPGLPARQAGTIPTWSPYPATAKACPETPMSLARQRGERPRAWQLTELPAAQAFAAVDRRVDGCPAPLVVSRLPRQR